MDVQQVVGEDVGGKMIMCDKMERTGEETG
jgi:hypothetical protein